MTSLLTEFRKRNLTYRAWLPYNYNSSTIVFCLTYAHQLISLTAGSLVNVACDSLICGLLVHICCQIEILEYRLSKISNGYNNLHDCIRHHDGIFKLVILLFGKHSLQFINKFILSLFFIYLHAYIFCSFLKHFKAFAFILYYIHMYFHYIFLNINIFIKKMIIKDIIKIYRLFIAVTHLN